MVVRLLCIFVLFGALSSLRKGRRDGQNFNQSASAGSERACPGPLATGPISSTTHAVPVEGSELTKLAFSSCYKPSYQTSNRLWSDVRTFLPDVWVWLGDNMYWDGSNLEAKRQAYNEARDDVYYRTYGPPASPKIPVTGTWDDHDFAQNNDGKYYMCKRETQDEFVNHFNVPVTDPRHPDFAGAKQEGIFSSVMFTKSSATLIPTIPPTPAPPTPPVQTCTPSDGGNGVGEGDFCVFPFIYSGANSECTSAGHDQPWCYTTECGNSCEGTEWGNCECGAPTPPAPTPSSVPTCGGGGGNNEGDPCVFPFIYGGTSYSECTTGGHDQPWCYTTQCGNDCSGTEWGNCECDSSAQVSLSQRDENNGVHLINLDTRYFRSPTFSSYGSCEGSASEMLGETQWAWLDAELARPSEVKVISSAIQVLPPLGTANKNSYCAYDGNNGDFNAAIERLNETGKVGTDYEAWAEIPFERERLLRKCQKAMSDGNAKAIIFISGDQHWAEISAKVMPADPVYGAQQVLHEVTSSGIDQSWNYFVVNDNRLQLDAGPEFNAVTTKTSSYGHSSNCQDAHHVCTAQANYGQIEVDFVNAAVYLRIKTPHNAGDPTASEVKLSL